MADTRINALSTATVSISDDFLPIDGTTAGTKKLSAYNPSFGGNATVGGTLTVTSTVTAGGLIQSEKTSQANDTSALFFNAVSGADATLGALRIGFGARPSATGANRYGYIAVGDDAAMRPLSLCDNGSGTYGQVLVRSTTASTSTSSGALVVGNGTSGGLGVGGQVSCLGFLLSGNGAPRHANTDATFYSNATSSTTMHIAGFSGGSQSADILKVSLNGISEWLAVKASGQVACYATTASNNTSSGALVVSGGVGVAKEMYLGGGLLNVAKAGAGATIEINADSGFASKLAMQRAATNRWTLEVDSSDVLTLKSLGTTAALTMTGTTSAEFVGSIKTAAPSGGTAANWKLGTVATVSPTSPNRTIEVDIGGTIYYIHAKTTNN